MMSDTAASSWASGASIKAGIYRDATKFCQEQGKEMLALRSRQQDASMSRFGNAELHFKCLLSNDPEFARRGDMEFSPDVRVEIKK